MEQRVLTDHERLIQNRTMFAIAYYQMYKCTFDEALLIFDQTTWFLVEVEKEKKNVK
jgi:hypothetical protein